MAANSFGRHFQIVSFGESHGAALGVVIDGCPAQVPFDEALLAKQMARRRPGASPIVSQRQESDRAEVLSGVFENLTLGTPIAIMVRNQDARAQDYAKDQVRNGHADDTWKAKFGHTDYRGGGRASGRETVARVLGGAVAQMALRELCPRLSVFAFATSIGPISLNKNECLELERNLHSADAVDPFSSRMPNMEKNRQVEDLLTGAKRDGKSYGGTVEILLRLPPAGLGQPVFHKLKADLAAAFMGVGAVAGVELGSASEAVHAEGSVFHNDSDVRKYGGLRGGISTGEDIIFRILVKPTASVLDVSKRGRHDPCIIPRAIPVLEAMAWLTLADHVLWRRQDRING